MCHTRFLYSRRCAAFGPAALHAPTTFREEGSASCQVHCTVLPRAAIAGALLMLLAAVPVGACAIRRHDGRVRPRDRYGRAAGRRQVVLARPDIGVERTVTTGPAATGKFALSSRARTG